jgi:tetratricopeptide (TPR) repeat protein
MPLAAQTAKQNAAKYLERGRHYYQSYNLNLAIAEFMKGLDAAKFEKDRRSRESIAAALGVACMDQGDYRKAVYYFGEALNDAEVLKDKKRVTADLINLGIVHGFLDNGRKALSYYEDALKLSRERYTRDVTGTILLPMAEAYGKLGLKQKSYACLMEALKLFTAAGKQGDVGNTLSALGDLYRNFGEYSRAVAYYESALKIGRQAHDRELTSTNLSRLGEIECERGNFDRALSCLKEAIDLSRESRNPKKTAESYNVLGLAYLRYGDFRNALISCASALETAKQMGSARLVSVCFQNMGRIYQLSGDNPKAIAHYIQALNACQEAGFPVVFLHGRMADCYLSLGQLEKAEEECIAAADPVRLGRLNLARENYRQAISCFCRTFEKNQKERDERAVFASYTGIGHALSALGDDRSAVINYAKAITLLEDREQVARTGDALAFSAEPIDGFFAGDAYEGMVHALAKMDNPDESFFYADALKLRLFARSVQSHRYGRELRGIPPDMAQEEDANRYSIDSLERELSGVRSFGMSYNLEVTEQELQAAQGKQRRLVDRLRKLYPEYASIRYPQSLRVKDLNLRDNEVLLEFVSNDQASYLFLVNGKTKRLKLRRISLPRDKVRVLVAGYMTVLRSGQGSPQPDAAGQAGHRLFDEVFGHMLDDVAAGTTLVIVPDEAFGNVPFEALEPDPLLLESPGRAVGDARPPARTMSDRWNIMYAQSATWFTLLRERERYDQAGDEALIVGSYGAAAGCQDGSPNPEILATIAARTAGEGNENGKGSPVAAPSSDSVLGGCPAVKEVAGVMASLYGPNAVVLSSVPARGVTDVPFSRYRSILWGGRAFFDNDIAYVRQPFLVLPEGIASGRYGRLLVMNEVLGLKMPAESIIVPYGAAVGRGALEMARAFQAAGCDAVILSRWQTTDEATALFCSSVYRHIASGGNLIEALALARKTVRANGYEHPVYWAGFMLVGR